MKGRKALKISTIVAILIFPTLFMKKPRKNFIIIFLFNGLLNVFLQSFLIEKKYLRYPVRYFPKVFKNNILYDYLICPLISVWYCQSTFSKGIRSILKQGILYAIFQTLLEYYFLIKTKLIRYKKWTIIHTFFTLLIFKTIIIRGTFGIINWVSSFSKPKEII